MRRQALFLGCVLPLRFPGIELAARRVFSQLGIPCADLEGYSCCPEPVILGLADRDMALAVSARNLALAERQDADLAVMCNGCYETLAEADATLRHDEQARGRVGQLLDGVGTRYDGTVGIKHFVELLHEDVGVERIAAQVTTPVDVTVGVHYGCHLFREVEHADTRRKPRMLRALIEATGARVVDSGLEDLCCGFPISQFDKRMAMQERLRPKLRALSGTSAECILFCCPACLNQFESGQGPAGDLAADVPRYPCLHILELLALAFGMPPAELHLDARFAPSREFVDCFWG
jgi:heterodisulfide reductase subunit B